jgi:hypothetical protein
MTRVAWQRAGLGSQLSSGDYYERQNGIHVSPTFMVDGLVQADMSSGDPVADWVSRILKD